MFEHWCQRVEKVYFLLDLCYMQLWPQCLLSRYTMLDKCGINIDQPVHGFYTFSQHFYVQRYIFTRLPFLMISSFVIPMLFSLSDKPCHEANFFFDNCITFHVKFGLETKQFHSTHFGLIVTFPQHFLCSGVLNTEMTHFFRMWLCFVLSVI